MVFDLSYGLLGSCVLMVLVLHFFSSFFATVDEPKKYPVAEEDDKSHFLLRPWIERKKVLIIVAVFVLVRVQDLYVSEVYR